MTGPSPSPGATSETAPTVMARVAPGGPWRRMLLAVLALVGAGPTLIWAFAGAQLMHDDWWLADRFAQGGVGYRWSELWTTATQSPARPGAAVYYAVSYGLFGTNPVLHALLLAVVNGLVAVLVFLVAERMWRTDLAFWVAAVYAVLPNRGSTRLWFAVATYPLAVALVLVGVLLLLRGRPLIAGLVFAVATLTYEGVAGLALLAMGIWVLADVRPRWRMGLAAVTPIVLAGALLYLISPKRSGSTQVGGFTRLMSSQFGVGSFEWTTLARYAPVVLAVGLTIVVALPHPLRGRYRPVVLAGLVLLLAGWAPFFMTNWPIATDGFFDRANGVIGLGTAVLMGALLCWLVEVTPSPAGTVVAFAVVGLLLGLNAPDVRAFRQATDQGATLLDQVAVDVPVGSGPVRVVPPPDAVRGVAQYPAGSNLTSALRFRRGDLVTFWIEPGVEEEPPPADAACYDPTTRVLAACTATP